jgi:hypothetical protein
MGMFPVEDPFRFLSFQVLRSFSGSGKDLNKKEVSPGFSGVHVYTFRRVAKL